MKKGLSLIGKTIFGLVMVVTFVVDLVIQVQLVANGNLGGALLYFFIGWPITLTIGYWISMLASAPFLVAGHKRGEEW